MKENILIDCISKREYELNVDAYIFDFKRVVYKLTKNGALVVGYTKEKTPYRIYVKYLDRVNHPVMEVVSKDVFIGKRLLWDHVLGVYIYSKEDTILNAYSRPALSVNRGHYSFGQNYSANNQLKYFTDNSINKEQIYNKTVTRLIPYTIGIEFETANGTIPEDECVKAGLIPLRDGSISGFEYASIVLDPTDDGFERLLYQTGLLKQYTVNNRECSTHIHFGGFPVTLQYLYTVYSICKKIEKELASYLPCFVFNTAAYKSSGKDYCNKLRTVLSSKDMYQQLCGRPYYGSLNQSHPNDVDGNHKWNIYTRYMWVNFINALFYNKNKTIEFRCLAPTSCFNKLVGWIYVFSAILKYSEKLCEGFDVCEDPEIPDTISIKEIVHSIYPHTVANNIDVFLSQTKKLKERQEIEYYDRIGETTSLDEEIFTNCIFN